MMSINTQNIIAHMNPDYESAELEAKTQFEAYLKVLQENPPQIP